MEDSQLLPFDVIATILRLIPERRRYSCRLISKACLAVVDSSITQIDLSKKNVLEIFTNYMDTPIIHGNAEKISRAERILMIAARRFTNLKKIKLGAESKSVRTTYIAYPSVLGIDQHNHDYGVEHPLASSFTKKRALDDFAPFASILQDVNKAVTRHKEFTSTLLWSEFTLKRARDDIDPMVIVHLVKNCPKLTELQLYGITRVTDDILAAIVDLRPNITQLNLINTSVSILGLEYALNRLPNLENLSIGRTISSGYLLCSPHRNFPAEKMLKIKDLDVWKKLRKFRVSYHCVKDMTPLLAECKNLTKFHSVGVSAILMPYKVHLSNLTSLDVEVSSTFDVVKFITENPQLEHIYLRGNVEDEQLHAITNSVVKLTKLRISVYYDTVISNDAVRPIIQKHAKTLKSLELCGIRTIDPSVIDVKLPALKTLVLKKCSKINGSDVVKFVPRRGNEVEYTDCVRALMAMDVSKLANGVDAYEKFHYYDKKNGFDLRTEIGSDFDPAYW